jgi:hypothetical protein
MDLFKGMLILCLLGYYCHSRLSLLVQLLPYKSLFVIITDRKMLLLVAGTCAWYEAVVAAAVTTMVMMGSCQI